MDNERGHDAAVRRLRGVETTNAHEEEIQDENPGERMEEATSMRIRRRGTFFLALAAMVAVGAVASTAALTASGANSTPRKVYDLPRSSTLYTTGTMWGPYSDFNPFKTWDYVTGTIGLVYETAFRYDPLHDHFIPWLATKGTWKTPKVYVMTVRKGVKWSDGQPLTAADVKFTFEVGKIPTATFHQLWTSGLKSVHAVGKNTVVFTFSSTPNYQEWDGYLYQVAIVPQHIWKNYSKNTIVSGNVGDINKLVGTGPYTYSSGKDSTESFTWKRRDGWWATQALGLKPTPQYIVDIFNGSNNASLANLLAGHIDLSNNFVLGIDSKVGGKIKTYFNGKPFMLAGNTAWLVPNTTHKPLGDPAFRRALADSININQIVSADYSHIVTPASPTGLLPIWNKYINADLVKKYGFSYNVAKAKSILAANGYKDTNGDGYVENKDGSKINLSLVVPNGWSDWMTAIQIIAQSAKAAGIHITPAFPDYNTLVDDRGHARFDLVINNDQQISNTPWNYYNYVFRLPLIDNQTTANFERFESPAAWALTQKLDKTPTGNVKAMNAVINPLQKIFLQNLPVIPLWYNGVWAQWNTSQWTSWPNAQKQQYLPAMWRGYLNMTGIDMLTHLKHT
jgi:peptide/nickel transport system substrate-binding protein